MEAIYATDVSNAYYRAILPLHELQRRGHKYKSLGGFHAERDFKAQAKIVRRVHVVTATTDYLAERYASAWGVEPLVIENYLSDHHIQHWESALEAAADAAGRQVA